MFAANIVEWIAAALIGYRYLSRGKTFVLYPAFSLRVLIIKQFGIYLFSKSLNYFILANFSVMII
ncbi:hypothetical protein FC89_GL001833 [Liquorilactobacillus ghanensis DSM 18630]|uniref:Uncharacterized protein n=1 Tax=Liquorilactobacillus ghanensis DSM 18630 TaxID=1423750 RepID=A0A0R1VRA1_9LACO|nr:hypothetical protein FC89_GL001833 [Liquorilactobacillus ghanensis DSM 18630]